MFKEEQSFGLAVAALLFQVIANRVAAKVPNHRRRAETDFVTLVLQTPANVDVIPGSSKNGIETGDSLERFTTESHVATGYMFSDFIIEQNVSGGTG